MKIVSFVISGLFIASYLPVCSVIGQTTKIQQSPLIEISSLSELNILLKTANEKMVFIDFYSDLCPPCRQFRPLYENWARLFGKEIIFVTVNAGRFETNILCKEFEISGLPTLIVLDSQGRKIDKLEKEAVKKLDVKKFLAETKASDSKFSNK